MLLHYAQSAPLKRLTQEYQTANDRLNTHHIIEQLKGQINSMQQMIKSPQDHQDFVTRVKEMEEGMTQLDAKTTLMIKEQIEQVKLRLVNRPTDFVQNEVSKVWHLVLVDGVANPPLTWSTKCGWKFANSQFIRATNLPTIKCIKCDKCFHLERCDDSDTDSSSESSS